MDSALTFDAELCGNFILAELVLGQTGIGARVGRLQIDDSQGRLEVFWVHCKA